ncbi:MAG: BlaI family penicillinase repressor [Rubritalea sp.]|jgi:BlaI family penicillinase repressor
MKKVKHIYPTDAELSILKILWLQGDLQVKEVHERFEKKAGKKVGYTTVLKFMQIMLEKGLVMRLSEKRPHVYRAVAKEVDVERSMLGSWMDKLCKGSASELAMKALGTRPVSKDELAELRCLLDDLEEKGGKDA